MEFRRREAAGVLLHFIQLAAQDPYYNSPSQPLAVFGWLGLDSILRTGSFAPATGRSRAALPALRLPLSVNRGLEVCQGIGFLQDFVRASLEHSCGLARAINHRDDLGLVDHLRVADEGDPQLSLEEIPRE